MANKIEHLIVVSQLQTDVCSSRTPSGKHTLLVPMTMFLRIHDLQFYLHFVRRR